MERLLLGHCGMGEAGLGCLLAPLLHHGASIRLQVNTIID
jgi:hypothetical protein